MGAAEGGRIEVAGLLLDRGANFEAKDEVGMALNNGQWLFSAKACNLAGCNRSSHWGLSRWLRSHETKIALCSHCSGWVALDTTERPRRKGGRPSISQHRPARLKLRVCCWTVVLTWRPGT